MPLLWLLGCTPPAPAPAAAPPTPVKTLVLAAGPAAEEVRATGVVEVRDSVDLSPEAAGVVAEVAFEDGERVRKGQRLVRLRDAEARAGVAEARARLELAALELGRTEKLSATDNATTAELDRARAQRDLAQAQLDRAEEALRRTSIVAPFDGVCGVRGVAPGQVVSPATLVTHLDALDPALVVVHLPEADVGRVAVGQRAEVTLPAVAGAREGEVVYLAPRASVAARTVEARIRLPNADLAVRPGLSASVSIAVGRVEDAVWVPTYAVVQSAAGASAWVVDAASKVEPRVLTLGTREPERVRVLSGLSAGETLVVEGYARLRPGAVVSGEPVSRP